MGIVVQKYGGTSVADKERIFRAARRAVAEYEKGNKVVVVVSAQGDTTDELIEKAKEINENPSKREMDMLLSTGEQISIALMAMAIEKLGYPVISLTGWQAGIKTDSNYSNARIKEIDTERLQRELDKRNIVVVAGFQGINKYDDITTLGRGGSDTTAVALAAALKADKCEIYTDVDGVYTADPRIVPNASKLKEISYDEMLELATLGAKVLHNRSVELAKKYNIPIVVRSSFNDNEGTVVKEVSSVEKLLVSGVACDKDIARVAVIGVENVPGKAFQIFSLLAKENINVDIILQSIGREKTKDISFTVSKSNLKQTLDVLTKNLHVIGAKDITYADNVAKVSIVGAGMVNNPGVAAMMFEALYDAGINIEMISTSEIKISVLIDEKDAEKAVRAIHDKFKLHLLNSNGK
ncbi:aspartate kinase [Caldicellulosiruptor saccharolyticus DSM 8903]|uniref:Aspartokinase n=1 Tax=Caldicellulosiruptor saccharolyticus (strain ATCC 43494 / DSM 8903 / Tp8T 6331) TaxID=351627 RepID=A4XI70_CALS8|nr:aspartate kinase [Caldicellulosiruptor saccharolyticus]ABP66605.1 aspartate kinase [Caldicellulosiruptor saccharolyticus DSM 8903]